MPKLVVVLLALFISVPAGAAPSPAALCEGECAYLQLPLNDRLQWAQNEGVQVLPQLEALVFDETQSMQTRWRALTLAGRVFAKASRPLLEKAATHPHWFLRNAALMTVPYADRKWAIHWSLQLLDDKAVVVRAAAADALKKLKAFEARPALWQKLYDPQNFKQGKSLWVRKNIVAALAHMVRFDDKQAFIKILKTDEPSLYASAVQALESINPAPSSPLLYKVHVPNRLKVSQKRKLWLSWWQQQNTQN